VKKEQLTPLAVVSAVRSLRAARAGGATIVVDGAAALVPLLARELREGGNGAAVREGGPAEGAAVLVWVGEADEGKLRAADRAHVPIVAVTDADRVPYVLDTGLVRVPAGEGFPVGEIAAAIARRAGDAAPALAAELPRLRPAVVDQLIRVASRRSGLVGGAVFVPGADLPVLTAAQVRLAARIALAHGKEFDRNRALELLGVVGAGFGFRALARSVVGVVPFAGWALKGAIAYGGTRAVGEAAHRYFERLP
jgi:uncharacterized protein (DUF697 family)